jgi:hypothetical protein
MFNIEVLPQMDESVGRERWRGEERAAEDID